MTKRILSLVMAFAMLCSVFAGVGVVNISAEARSIATFNGSDFSEMPAELELSTGAAIKDGVLEVPAAAGEMIAVKDAYWHENNRVTKISFDYQASNDYAHYIWLGYDKSTKNGFGLYWIKDSGGLMIRAGLCVDGAYNFYGDNSAKFLAAKYGGGNTIMGTVSATAKVSVEATIEYISETKVKVTLKATAPLEDGSGNLSGSCAITYNLTNYSVTVNAGMAPAFAVNQGFTLDNLVVESDADAVNNFLKEHNAILTKENSEISVSDMDAFLAAAGDIGLLSSSAQSMLTAEKAKLDSLDSVFAGLVEPFSKDTFDNAWYTSKYWTNNPTISNEDGKNYITMGDTTLNKLYWPENVPVGTAKMVFKGRGYIYPVYDAASQNGCGIFVESGYNLKISRLIDGTYENKGDASGNALVGPWVSDSAPNSELRKKGYNTDNYWTTVEMRYDYSEAHKGIIKVGYTLTATTSDGTKTNTIPEIVWTYDFGKADAITDFRPHVKADSSFKIAEFSYTPSEQYYLDAALFNAEYGDLLEKESYDALTAQEKEQFAQLKQEYLAFSAETKEYLRETGVVDKIAKFLADTATVTAFREKYAEVIGLTEKTVTPVYNDTIVAAMTEYSLMGEEDKIILSSTNEHFGALLKALETYVEPRPAGDYSAFTEDFEKTLLNWKIESNPLKETAGGFEIVEDPDNADNKVLAFNSAGNFLTVRDELWPSDGVMTTVSFKMKVRTPNFEGNAARPNAFIYSYSDYNNYLCYYMNATGTRSRFFGLNDGESESGSWAGTGSITEFNDWVDISISYTNNGAIISYVDSEGNTHIATAKTNVRNGRLAFGFTVNSRPSDNYVYIDDITVKFEKGDFDNNVAPKNIQVYYSGNTALNPSEIVTISGENLFNTVSGAEIMQLSDAEALNTVSYIKEMSFDTLGADGGVTPTWDDEKAEELEIIQWTATSLKFVIPKDYSVGVYAVKLKAKIEGEKDVIIYINNPDVSFVLGSDGEICSPDTYVQIVGSNIALNKADKAKVAIKGEKGIIFLEDILYSTDEYALKAKLPSDLDYGTYELYVHNGYGDATAWSQPIEITVGGDIRNSWSQKIFNVTSFGATGDSETNDTPAIVKALEAASNNIDADGKKGGIVYFPQGIYRVVNTLVIPKNVVIAGAGIEFTRIIFTPTHWDVGEAPKSLIVMSGDCEIKDLAIYGTRHKSIFTVYENGKRAENIYLHDLHVQFSVLTGLPTDASANSITGAMTTTEARNACLDELSGSYYMLTLSITKRLSNIQMYNVTNVHDQSGRGIHLATNYSRFENFQFDNLGWCGIGSDTATVMVNNTTDWSCMGIFGNMYVKDNHFIGPKNNNHEIFTSDGTHIKDGISIQFIGDKPEILAQYGITETDDVTYRFLSENIKENTYVGNDIYVISGQGLGQTREIVWNSGYLFKVDEQFSVIPNRNSLVAVQRARSDQYFIDNIWENGGGCGTYGSMINAIFDGNTYVKHGGQIFDTHLGVNWYITIQNAVLKDPFYMHGDGMGGTQQSQTVVGRWQFKLLHGLRPYSSMCYTFKNNQMLDGSFFDIDVPNVNWLRDFVIENNFVGEEAEDYAINIGCGSGCGGGDGILLKDNTYDCAVRYSSMTQSYYNGSVNDNKVGEKRVLFLESYSAEVVLGDVTLDGRVTVKDSTLLRLYILGKTELSSEALKRADLDGDGEYTVNDVNCIRKKII